MEFSHIVSEVTEHGYTVLPDVLAPVEIVDLISAVERHQSQTLRRKSGAAFAMRNLIREVPEVSALSRSALLLPIAQCLLGESAFPVRGILFDKTPEANWKVSWHQDLAIAVAERAEVEGFSGWSIKSGITHVLPPAEVLDKMVTLRVHLDDCGLDNGPLRVISGSHRLGRLSDAEVEAVVSREKGEVCPVASGGVLVMKPLLLHASSPAISPQRRRVIHLEYAVTDLPAPLEWNERERARAAG